MQDYDTVHNEWCELMEQTREVVRTRCEAAKHVLPWVEIGVLGETAIKREVLRVSQAWVDALAAEVKLEEDLEALEAIMAQDQVEQR
jgi:hypothetical protein